MKKTVIGIDVGGTNTKIVGFYKENGNLVMLPPQFVKATDHLTSIYGAFGKFLNDNHLSLDDITDIRMTGAGASLLKDNNIYGKKTCRVEEFNASGIGGLYLSGLDDAIIVSMGTGTAIIHAKKKNNTYITDYMGGTGVGGGTLIGLSHRMLGVDTIQHFETLCEDGNLDNVDLRIKDLVGSKSYNGINENLTASNFGKLSDLATPSDCALGIANLVGETIAMLSVFASRIHKVKDIVLLGNLTTMKPIRTIFENLNEGFGVNVHIPDKAQFGTVIGAGLVKTKTNEN